MRGITDHLILGGKYAWRKFLGLLGILGIGVGLAVVVCGGFVLLVILIPLLLAAIVSKLHGNELIQVAIVLCYYVPLFRHFTRTEHQEFHIHL